MEKSKLSLGVALVALILATGAYFYPKTTTIIREVASELGASGTRFPNGLSADTTSPVAGEVRGTTYTFTSSGSLGGLLTLNSGQLRSYTNSTSTTATAQTLVLADVNGYDTVLLTPNTGALTLTFFASSSASTWLPAAGDMQETCFVNSTSTAAATIIFAAGTGIDLETASSSPTDLTLLAGNTACFKFIRQKATASAFDISALMTEYTNGD